MIILSLLLLFLFPACIVMMAMFKFSMQKKIGNSLVFILSFGVAPFINSLLMYYLIALVPNNHDWFYISFLSLFWVFILYLVFDKYDRGILVVRHITKRLSGSIKQINSYKKYAFLIIISLFLIAYSTQALFYPIIDGDNAQYINQGRAVYEQKSFDWQNKTGIMINGDDYYVYNPMIRPAVPFFMSAVYLVANQNDGTFIYQFLHWYFFVLFFLIFLYAVDLLYKKINGGRELNGGHIFWSILTFLFSWGLVRLFMFGLKESIIYFYLLASLILISKVIDDRREKVREQYLQILLILAIVLGLNMFVNLNGIIIAGIILIILFLNYDSSVLKRTFFIFIVFVLSLPFGGFEFFNTFYNVFFVSVESFIRYVFPSHGIININPTNIAYDQSHQNLFQFKSWADYYIKGKFQILSNIGYFGFYFWFFLAILIVKFKEIVKNIFGRVIILFMGLYFFVIIDPLSLNHDQYSIVLWGSQKYSMLILMLGLIVLSVYMESIISYIQKLIERESTLIALGIALFSLLFFHANVIEFGFSTLSKSIQFYKADAFYMNIVNNIFWFGVASVAVLLVMLFIVKFLKNKIIYRYLSVCFFIGCFIIFPFFLTSPGKVPLIKTFSYVFSGREVMLKNSIYEGDIFKVYFYAKSTLPKGSILATNFVEVYLYDDHFRLIEKFRSQKNSYTITASCNDKDVVFKSGNISLCSS